jgi:hypothetical protein
MLGEGVCGRVGGGVVVAVVILCARNFCGVGRGGREVPASSKAWQRVPVKAVTLFTTTSIAETIARAFLSLLLLYGRRRCSS